jgi:hypothetical protein
MKIKSGTITQSYSRNSQTLLSNLLTQSGSRKTIVTYGKYPDIEVRENCNIINIYRRQDGEYAGILNFYKVIL